MAYNNIGMEQFKNCTEEIVSWWFIVWSGFWKLDDACMYEVTEHIEIVSKSEAKS